MENKLQADELTGNQSAHVGAGQADPKVEADKRPRGRRPKAQGLLVEHEGAHSLAKPQEPHATHGVESRDTHTQAKPKVETIPVDSFKPFVLSQIKLVESANPAYEKPCVLLGACESGLFVAYNGSVQFAPFAKLEQVILK